MIEWLKGPLFAAVATSAFSVLFGLHSVEVFLASGGAALGWAVYQSIPPTGSAAFPAFLAALAAGLYSEVVARFRHRPATVYSIASIIPLVPGGGMYYTMMASLNGDSALSVETGLATLMTAFAIAVGLAVSHAIGRMLLDSTFRPSPPKGGILK
jgi:uncharacterized membrane protein YjjB (DUF3815 family)